MSYGVFAEQRTDSNPYLMGDLFTKGNREFTIIEAKKVGITKGFITGFMKQDSEISIVTFGSLAHLLANGFSPVLENIELCKQYAENEVYAIRRLKDGTMAGLNPLLTTTAVVIDFDEYVPFESRYCFRGVANLPSHISALYWLCRMESAESLPVGNCAYRGRLGTKPIDDEVLTEDYYEKLNILERKPFIDGMDMRKIAHDTMLSFIGNVEHTIVSQSDLSF